MIYDLYFHYRIEKEAGFNEDEYGDPREAYLCIKFSECNTESRDETQEKQSHINMIPEIAEMLGVEVEYIVPISKEEYDEDSDSDDEVDEYDWRMN